MGPASTVLLALCLATPPGPVEPVELDPPVRAQGLADPDAVEDLVAETEYAGIPDEPGLEDFGEEPFPEEPDLEGEGPDAEPLVDDYDPLTDSPEALKARGLVRAGIVALATGAVLGAGAVAMGTSDSAAQGAGNNGFTDARNQAAVIMGLPAALLVSGGAAMLGLGLRNKKRLRAEFGATPESAALRLSLSF